MRITLLQQDIVWGNPQTNLCNINEQVKGIEDTDLLILPEMFTTGFAIQPQSVAEPEGGVGLAWMKQTAMTKGYAICGSIAIESRHKYFNRLYFVLPSGKVLYYDKRHLFTYGGEKEAFTEGNRRVIISYQGVRILLQTCYDLRFPVWSRNRNDYDMIVYVANWPAGRISAWSTLLRARAIENQCFVAGVNRVGVGNGLHYSGSSALIDFQGEALGIGQDNKECLISGVINMKRLQAFRKEFPVLSDSDDFLLMQAHP